MNILVAPDSFEGSATGKEVGQAMKCGILKACSTASVDVLPMADVGEGTMIILVEAFNGSIVEVETKDQKVRPTLHHNEIIENNSLAIIELSSVSGLNKIQVN